VKFKRVKKVPDDIYIIFSSDLRTKTLPEVDGGNIKCLHFRFHPPAKKYSNKKS